MISLLRVTSGRELVVVDALFLHTQGFQQWERRFYHGRRAAHIGVWAPQIPGEPLNHTRDHSGLAAPAVVIARLGQGRYVLEVRQLLLERVQLSLETEILLRPRAVEEGGLAVQAALGYRPQQRQDGRHARPAAHEH